MSNPRLSSLLFSAGFLVAACGGDDSGGIPDAPGGTPDGSPADAPRPDASPPDASPPDAILADAAPIDLSCMGMDPPTTAPDPLTLAGRVTNALDMTGLAGAQVEAFLRDGTSLGSVFTASDGSWTLMVTSGGNAMDGYIKVTAGGKVDTYVYPPEPVYQNLTNLLTPMVTTAERTALYSLAGAGSVDTNRATGTILVLDCANNPVQGATVSVTPMPGRIRYIDTSGGGLPSFNDMGTTADGVAAAFNVPATEPDTGMMVTMDVDGDYFGTPFRQVNAESWANSLVITVIHP